ncbi:MAG: cell division protein SepF [Halanaerobiales bacterium]
MFTRLWWNKLLDFFGLHNDHDEEEREIIDGHENKRIVSIYKRQGFRIMIHSPESFAEVQNIADQLKSRKPVILNLEEMEIDNARRVVDFISGAVYGIDGNVQKISDAIFVYTPPNVQLDGEVIKKSKSLFR